MRGAVAVLVAAALCACTGGGHAHAAARADRAPSSPARLVVDDVDAPLDPGLSDADWHAQWIRRSAAPDAPGGEDYSLFRREVTLAPSPITRARVYASASHQYELHVNGRRVGGGPSFAYPDEQYYAV